MAVYIQFCSREILELPDEISLVHAAAVVERQRSEVRPRFGTAATTLRPNAHCTSCPCSAAPALRLNSIQPLYANKLDEGLAPLTVKKITKVLHRALQMAVRWNFFLVRNPGGQC